MVGELGHYHVGQQARRGDVLVDYLRRHWRLDQRFVLVAGPFPTDALFDVEHARREVLLLTDIFPDALKLAVAGALDVVWLVMD